MIFDKLDVAIKTEIKGTFGNVTPTGDGTTYAVSMQLLADPNAPITDNFVTAYARLWIDMWQKSNSISYNNVVKHWKEKGLDTSVENMAEQMKNVLYGEISW